MSFQIDRGLFRADFIDHHAVLGVPVDAEVKDIRKRYLKIARQLHPDSAAQSGPEAQQQAGVLLSKMVNPAWERLSQERERNDYLVVLKLKGQAAIQQTGLDFSGEMAKQLLNAANPDHFYQTSLRDLAAKQYEQVDQAVELIAQISELNLAYLMRKESKGEIKLNEPKKTLFTGSNVVDPGQSSSRSAATAAPAPPPPQNPRITLEDQYYRRAEDLVTRGNFARAVLELRDGLKINPASSQCHSLLGFVYLKQNQGTMAKIHFTKALESNPQNEMAVKGMDAINRSGTKGAGAKGAGAKGTGSKGATNPTKDNKPNDKSGGGLFGLFGKKK
jgi:curved DNA-binding protein CbpA